MKNYTRLYSILGEIQGFGARVFYSIQRIETLYEAAEMDDKKLAAEYEIFEDNIQNLKIYFQELKQFLNQEEDK